MGRIDKGPFCSSKYQAFVSLLLSVTCAEEVKWRNTYVICCQIIIIIINITDPFDLDPLRI